LKELAMKHKLLMAAAIPMALVFVSVPGMAAGEPIDAPIKRVTVYSDQARIARTAHLNLQAGDHVLIVEQIPNGANEASFRASANGVQGITILGLSHKQVEHLESPQERTAGLQKEIKKIERGQKQILTDHLAAFSDQRQLMGTISKKAGDQMAWQVGKENLSVTKWDEAYRYIGRELRAIDDSMRMVRNQLEDIDNQLEQLNLQLTASRDPQTKSSRTVQVDLRLERAGEVNVTLEYMVPGASWKSMYDARLVGDSGRVELSYNAEVTQHTGEDWNEVELTLSTAVPSRGTGPGEFMPRYFSEYLPPEEDKSPDATIVVSADRDIVNKFETANQTTITARPEFKLKPIATVDNLLRSVSGVSSNSSGRVFIRGGRAGEIAFIVDGVPVGDPLGGLSGEGKDISLVSGTVQEMGIGNSGYGPWTQKPKVEFATVAQVSNAEIRAGNATASFTSHRKETVLSGNSAVRTVVARWTLAGQMQQLSRPRTVEGAYRIVTIKNQSEVPLMPGKVAIFAESDFLGNAQLTEVIAPDQPFDLPFGLDSRLAVTRKLWSFKKTTTKDKIKLDYTVRISVVNHAAIARAVRVEEPLPVSRDNRVKIEFGDILPKMTSVDVFGRGVWEISVNPGDSTTFSIPVRMEYPAGMQIVEQ
jgi:hypothetical protein